MTEEPAVPSGMKKCKYCGREISEESSFCWYCGRELEARPERPDSLGDPRSFNRWLLVTLVSIVVFALILVYVLPLFP